MLKLEIGAGTKPQPGYVHHDIRQLDDIEIVCDARSFPDDEKNKYDEVYASNILEHFSRFEIDSILKEWIREKGITESLTIVDGDAKYIPIAAASILAKTAHDQWLKDYLETHGDLEEKYNLLSCKGYGTEKHRAGILQHGAEQEHRRLFLRKLLNQTCVIQDD
jgi:ribonuclease HII